MCIPIAQVVVDSSHLLLVVQAANLFTDPPQICEGKVRQLEYFVDSRHFMCNINKKRLITPFSCVSTRSLRRTKTGT